MTESNKASRAQMAPDKAQDRVPEKVQQGYFSELAKYQEQIRKTQTESGKNRAA